MNLRKIILEESDEFDWIRNITKGFDPYNPEVGDKFKVGEQTDEDRNTIDSKVIYTVVGLTKTHLIISWGNYPELLILANSGYHWHWDNYYKFVEEGKIIPFNYKINESDDFDWIRDEPIRVVPQIGDTIRVVSVGDHDAYLEWLGVWEDDYVAGYYGPYIEGEVIGFSTNQFYISEDNTGHEIYFPITNENGDLYPSYHKNEYPDLAVHYYKI